MRRRVFGWCYTDSIFFPTFVLQPVMDTLAIASLATDMSQAKTANAVQLAVLKKAMNIESQGALQLVQAATQATQYANPPHLGNSIDTFA